MIPVKYGSGYNLVQLEQAAAIVAVNQADGTIVIHQGGVEMGQGLATQALQVAAYVLGRADEHDLHRQRQDEHHPESDQHRRVDRHALRVRGR